MNIRRLFCLCLWTVAVCHSSGPVLAQNNVIKGLVEDIKQAQARLSEAQGTITADAKELAEQIQRYQNDVLALREKAKVKRRIVDEQTLALSHIQSRLQKWQQQENYQKHLLTDMAEQYLASVKEKSLIKTSLATGMTLLLDVAKQQQNLQAPDWQTERIMLVDGEYQSAEVLRLGPVIWFWQIDKQQAGLLDQDNTVLLYFDQPANQQVQMLYQSGQSKVLFDPTLGTATKLVQQQENPWQHLLRGGVWVLPIIAFGLFALIIGLLKAWQLVRLPKLHPLLTERIELLQTSNDASKQLEKLKPQLQGAQLRLLDITLSTDCGEQRDDQLLAFLLEYRQRLQANLGAIAITAAIAPLLGLLGTVSGMIETFNMMSLFGAGDPAVVSGGISKALITTELGLVVAIPALIIHALLNRFIRHHNTQLDATAIRLGKLTRSPHVTKTSVEQAA